jgi:hypothetical protein
MKDDGVRGILVQCTLADGTRMKDFWLKGNLAFDGEDKFHSVIVSTCVNQIADAVQNAD